MKTLNFILLLTVLLSCGDDNFRKVEKLSGFRVLGIKAVNLIDPTKSEINDTNQNIDLELIVSDVNGSGRSVTGEVVSCIDPGVGYGAEVSCDHAPIIQPDLNFDFDDPGLGAIRAYTGVVSHTVSYPGGILIGKNTRDQFNGVAYLVIFTFNVDGETHKVFKRIIVTNRGTLNSNPTAGNIQLNGANISAFPQSGQELSIGSSVPETYTYRTVENIDETRTEEFQVAWYVSEGELSLSKTYIDEATEYEGSAPTGDSVVVAIVRDDRGGLDYKIFPP
jgi:hypothetical protein